MRKEDIIEDIQPGDVIRIRTQYEEVTGYVESLTDTTMKIHRLSNGKIKRIDYTIILDYDFDISNETESEWNNKERDSYEEKKIVRNVGGITKRNESSLKRIYLYYLIDCNERLSGAPIGTLNAAFEEMIPLMRSVEEKYNIKLLIRIMAYSTGASWVNSRSVPIDDIIWNDLSAGGLADMGQAINLMTEELEKMRYDNPPIIILLSSCRVTDNVEAAIDRLYSSKWGEKAIKAACRVWIEEFSEATDDCILTKFTGTKELVFEARQSDFFDVIMRHMESNKNNKEYHAE